MVFPEFVSIEAFVESVLADERAEFSHEDLLQLWRSLQRPIPEIRKELEGYGLQLTTRPAEKRVRGFTSSSHDRWFGPGSCPTSGGAAYGQMMVSKYGSKDTPFG